MSFAKTSIGSVDKNSKLQSMSSMLVTIYYLGLRLKVRTTTITISTKDWYCIYKVEPITKLHKAAIMGRLQDYQQFKAMCTSYFIRQINMKDHFNSVRTSSICFLNTVYSYSESSCHYQMRSYYFETSTHSYYCDSSCPFQTYFIASYSIGYCYYLQRFNYSFIMFNFNKQIAATRCSKLIFIAETINFIIIFINHRQLECSTYLLFHPLSLEKYFLFLL